MAKVSPLMLAPPVIFLGLAVLFLVGMQRDDPNALPSVLEGRPAPAVAVTPFGDGPQISDEVLRAPGVKLVNYWASWCAPCRVEHPTLVELSEEGIPVHGVNYKDNPAKARAFLDELGDPYATKGADEAGRMALEWGVYGVPETYVIDSAGNIVLRFAGPVTQRALEEHIRPAIDAAR